MFVGQQRAGSGALDYRELCGLCGVPLGSYLDEMPCPHWFVAQGWRGFRFVWLARVFEVFDLGALIGHLRKLANEGGGDAGNGAAYRKWTENGVTHEVINWRKRSWAFSHETSAVGPGGEVSRFELATCFDGALIEKGLVELDRAERIVRLTPSVRRRRKVDTGQAAAFSTVA